MQKPKSSWRTKDRCLRHSRTAMQQRVPQLERRLVTGSALRKSFDISSVAVAMAPSGRFSSRQTHQRASVLHLG
jgi:hypothetical protein